MPKFKDAQTGGVGMSPEDEADQVKTLNQINNIMHIVGVLIITMGLLCFVWNLVDLLFLLAPCIDR